MPKPLALLVQRPGSAVVSLAKILEARDFSVHVSRNLPEAESVFSAFPLEQIKVIFVQVGLCSGEDWNNFMKRVCASPADLSLICYHPEHTHNLYNLIGHFA